MFNESHNCADSLASWLRSWSCLYTGTSASSGWCHAVSFANFHEIVQANIPLLSCREGCQRLRGDKDRAVVPFHRDLSCVFQMYLDFDVF